MSDTFKTWLKQQLDGLTNVKVCTFGQDIAVSGPVRKADLVVHTWAGIHVHIHLLEEPLKTRTIRRIVDGTTRVGVASLFLVSVRLLPAPGERVPGDRWYVALHALTSTRLYAFDLRAHKPVIRQVHFEKIGKPGEVETEYGPQIDIEQLRWYRNAVKSSLIKGFWMVADFGPDVNKKPPSAEFGARTDHQRARQNYAYIGHQSANSERRHQEHASETEETAPSTKKNRLELSFELLTVNREATREEVRAAFRKLALELHPDVSDLPKHEAEERFRALTEAYEYIRTRQGWS